MAITPTDNRIRYVTNTEGKTIDVIVPIELWQQIINSINIDSLSGLSSIDELEPKEQILAELQESIQHGIAGQTFPISHFGKRLLVNMTEVRFTLPFIRRLKGLTKRIARFKTTYSPLSKNYNLETLLAIKLLIETSPFLKYE